MLDINLLRTEPEKIRAGLLKKMDTVDLGPLLALDGKRRELIKRTDDLKTQRNTRSKEIGALKARGQDATEIMAQVTCWKDEIALLEADLAELDAQLHEKMAELPNLPDDDVLPGGKENNQVLRQWGEKPALLPKFRDHVELAATLGLIDFKRGVKLGGTGFWVYQGDGALLEWALLNYFITAHVKDGYTFILPPHLLLEECGVTAGQFPKFRDDVFHLESAPGTPHHFLLPTSETAIINLHRDEVIEEAKLPLKYFAYTPCYRREGGGYRKEERGTVRGHQFNKVEIFQYTTPARSGAAFEELVAKAERLVQGLGLHHQVTKLAARDCSAAMAKTFDIEVWLPSLGQYKEVSSASNARDFQARRGRIRYKAKETGKIAFLHSLNASGLATSRLLPAILEQLQQPDGSVRVPKVLQSWVGKKVLTP